MRQLIEAIRTRDFSLQYSLDHLRGEERNLAEQINEVVNEFRETTLLQEAKYQYFGTMLDTINAFLIVADAAEAGIAETGAIGDQDQRGCCWQEGSGCRKSECGEGRLCIERGQLL